jgi:hypothetical protein
MALPTLAASGEPNPLPTYPQPEEKEKGRRRRSPELRRLPRSRSRPRGGAGPAGATHACDLCFLHFLSVAPFCVPYQRRLPPRHSATHPSPTLLGAAGAGELSQKYDYADDFAAEDYPTPGSRPTESEIPIRHC